MKAKQIARRVLGTPAVVVPLRWLNTNPRLSTDARHRLYLRVSRRVHPAPGTRFTHRRPGGATLELLLDGTLRELYWTGEYEADTLPLFAAYASRSATVLDVGAADGVYALVAAAENPRARVLAFEPGLHQLDRLRHHVEANRAVVGDRIEIIGVALSNQDGTARFYDSASEGDSSLNADFRPGSTAREVTVARGDTVVAERLAGTTPDPVRIDLVKIDTESTEPDVLDGLAGTIERDRPVIFCEVLAGRTEDRLQQRVDAWDYRTWWLGPDGPVRRDVIVGDPANRHVNWLFLPDDRPPPTP